MLTQVQFINKVITSKDFSLISNNNLSIDYFSNTKDEFNFLVNHYKKYNQVPDIETFLKTFPNFEILEVNESTNYLVNELCREKTENQLAYSFNKVKDLLLKGETEAALNFYKSSAQKVEITNKLEAINILEDISRYEAFVDKCNDFNKYYISTGFKELDDSLGGGIDRKNAYFVVSARPGVGKTLVLVKMAAAAVEKGLRVGFYEGEMAVDKIAGRYDTLTSHISNGAITHGNSSIANQYKSFLQNLSSSKKGKFFILTRDMVSNDKMTVDVLSSFVEKYELDILFVDQISLLDSGLRSGKSFEQAAEISKALKNLQVRKHIPIVVASQQNREAIEEGKMAGTENLSLSDRIGQDATEVIYLVKSDDIMKIHIAKARDGAKKYQFNYVVDFDKGSFSYMPDGEENIDNTQDELEETYYTEDTSYRF